MTDRPRFGVWANVHGAMAALCHPDDPVDAWSAEIIPRVERLTARSRAAS